MLPSMVSARSGWLARKEIRLVGDTHGFRRVRKLTKDRLTADDHDLIVMSDDGRRAEEVLKLFPRHGC